MFVITGMQSCPCPEKCAKFLREQGREMWCVPKERQLRGSKFDGSMFEAIWERFPEIPERERDFCLETFREYTLNREKGNGNKFYMRGYTLSPSIFYLKDNKIYPIGGRESLRLLIGLSSRGPPESKVE
jgi:hypothetical protein